MKKNYTDKSIPLADILDNNKFVIPTFQRHIVWNNKRRKNFLNNVRNGEPFGIILIRENNGKYELIDGLQRISTIKDYCGNNKWNYLDESDIPTDSINKIIEVYKNSLIAQGFVPLQDNLDKLADDVRKKLFECIKGGLRVNKTIRTIVHEFNFEDAGAEIEDCIEEACDRFNEAIKLDDLVVPAINYIGPEENIPDVFYNLNTGGVQLSKYDTLSALWSYTKFVVTDDEITSQIKDKYVQLNAESNLEVDFNEEDLINEGISLHEYCYALSAILRDKNLHLDVLFGTNDQSTDPIGFEILALLLTTKVNQAGKLYNLLKEAPPAFLIKLKNVIKESAVYVEKALHTLLVGQNGNLLYSDNSYLTYHILVSYILQYYKIDLDTFVIVERQSTLSRQAFKKYVPLHYLYDCITDYWKTNRQVSDLSRDITNEGKREKYWYKIPRENWLSAISAFMEAQSGVAKTIPQKNKLFIDFLTRRQRLSNPNYEQYFVDLNSVDGEKYVLDIEHIVPQKRIEDHIKDLSIGHQRHFNVSDVGNLCYLTAKDNRAKKEKSIYESTNNRPSYVQNQKYLDCIFYPERSELHFLNYDNASFRDEYAKFLKSRHNLLENLFMYHIDQID